MAYLGQPLNPGWYWSGTRVCRTTSNTVECFQYDRAPAEAFATPSYPPIAPPPTGGGGGPSIIPTVPTDIAAPPGPLGPASAVGDSACGSCRKGAFTPTNPITGNPVTSLPPTQAPRARFPWWLWVLVALTLAEIMNRGRNP